MPRGTVGPLSESKGKDIPITDQSRLNSIRRKVEKRLRKEKEQLTLKFTKRRTLRIKNSKKRQLQPSVDKNSTYAVNQLTRQESDYEAQSIYETGNQSQLQISVAKPQPKSQSPNFPGFGNGNQVDGLRLSLQDSVECDITSDQVDDELQKASSTTGAECIGANQGCAMSSIDDREEAIIRFFHVDNTKLKLTDYLPNTKIYHLLNIRPLDTIRDTIIFTEGVNETSSNVINMTETDGFVTTTETTFLAADDLKSVTPNTFKNINPALKHKLFTKAEKIIMIQHKTRTIQQIVNSLKKTSKKDVLRSNFFSALSAHLSNGKRMPLHVIGLHSSPAAPLATKEPFSKSLNHKKMYDIVKDILKDDFPGLVDFVKVVKSLNRTRECTATCTEPYENASDDVRMDPDISPKLLKPRRDKEHYFETAIISIDSIQYVKKRRRGYGKKKSDMNEAVHAYQRQKMVTVSSESRNPIVYDNFIQTSGGMEEGLEINVFERSFRVVEHRVLFDSKINDVSELVRYQLNLSLRKVRESDPNKKSPSMYVYDPKIFEDALREIGIGVSEKSQDEDLIRYELYFPSGCRMVIAVPMNVPNKDKMNIEKGF